VSDKDVDWVVVYRLTKGIRVPNALPAEKKDAIRQLRRQGFMTKDISEMVGMHIRAVDKRIKELKEEGALR
jgi:hypothetical protein